MDGITRWSASVRWADLAVAVGIMLLFLLFRKVAVKSVLKLLAGKFRSSGMVMTWAEAFENPLRIFLIVLGAYLALRYFWIPERGDYPVALDHLFRSSIILTIGWGTFNLSAASSSLFEGVSRRFGLDESSMLIPFLSKALRFVIVVLTATAIGSEWGFSINGVVAGMGLGSLAVALAAKDTLGNIFGGIVIILEKPFAKGDWILTPNTEGMVEDITFRSTRIRTFADSVVTVPNATLSNEPITNWSRMGRRRVTFTLNVSLDTDPRRLEAAVSRIEEALVRSEHVHPGTIMVRFQDITNQGLGILIYYFTKTTVWKEYLKIRQEMNLMMLKVLEEEGVSLSYPIQRLRMEGGAQRVANE